MKAEFLVLGLLIKHDMHGYQLKMEVDELLGHLGSVSFGSIYPALRDLERRNAISKVPTKRIVSTDAIPEATIAGPTRAHQNTGAVMAAAATSLTGMRALRRSTLRRTTSIPVGGAIEPATPSGRRRKTYRITATGREIFQQMFADPEASQGHGFVVRLAFAGAVTASERNTLLEKRKEHLLEMQTQLESSPSPDADPHSNLVIGYELARIQGELDFLNNIVALDRSNELSMATISTGHPPSGPNERNGVSPFSSEGKR